MTLIGCFYNPAKNRLLGDKTRKRNHRKKLIKSLIRPTYQKVLLLGIWLPHISVQLSGGDWCFGGLSVYNLNKCLVKRFWPIPVEFFNKWKAISVNRFYELLTSIFTSTLILFQSNSILLRLLLGASVSTTSTTNAASKATLGALEGLVASLSPMTTLALGYVVPRWDLGCTDGKDCADD